uniref:Zmp:0000000735 n=1 Tax=Gouania willdenowi TaxID=441366 RepID=A0A8C5DYH3_GOUWI
MAGCNNGKLVSCHCSPDVELPTKHIEASRSSGLNENYIEEIYKNGVDGQILLSLNQDHLMSSISMKSGPAFFIIHKRNDLLSFQQKGKEKNKQNEGTKTSTKSKDSSEQKSFGDQAVVTDTQSAPGQFSLISKDDCKPRPFDQDAIYFSYVKHRVLPPASGAFNLIQPCHEYKLFAADALLDSTRLQVNFAREVLKFAIGCMNVRTNGTIHFGVIDYKHGEIIGIPVEDKHIFLDALKYIDRSVSSDKEDVCKCVRSPRFVEVMDQEKNDERYVVEVDIVPSIHIVEGKVYRVKLPNFRESTNKVKFAKELILQRVGSKTKPVKGKNLWDFFPMVEIRDSLRKEAEKNQFFCAPGLCQNLGRKLTMLMTSGKKFIEHEKWFILVTNKLNPEDLCNIDWLLNMNLFCVFDFDADSKTSGLCSKYLQHHSANMHFLQNYSIPSGMNIQEFTKQMNLFDQTSWIFCNGRTDFRGNESSYDEMTWIKTKRTLLKESLSLICKHILPKGVFQVIFLLTTPVEKPLLYTFDGFFTEMKGHDDIICICESEENFHKWQSFAEAFCVREAVDNCSVVGIKMSHVNATVQRLQPVNACAKKHLPVFVQGTCLFETEVEERMYSLEVLTVDHCDETKEDFIDEEKENIENQFYRGARVTWLNFWLAEHNFVGNIIQRDAYNDTLKILKDALNNNADQTPVMVINIYHHPGSGGSTVAKLVLWNNRKELRCAVVKPSQPASLVAQHAVDLREYEEKNPQRCLPTLLLIEDTTKEYLDDLRNELEVAIKTKEVQFGTLCFILLSCRRCHDPEKKCKESPLHNVSVTQKLSPEEKIKFAGKRQALEKTYKPQFILTFVLMSEEFDKGYVEQFVKHLLEDIDRQSVVTRLIHYVALLNTYVHNSFISQSHCEAMLALTIHFEQLHQHEFEKLLSDQAKLVFLHLKDDKTHIESIRIIHQIVAKEILQQLLGPQQSLGSLAMDLLCNDVLFEHTFRQDDYQSFLRQLFIKRSRISKGDEYDSLFSPLIDHVCKNEGTPNEAIQLLEKAYYRFSDDSFFAQQLARLHYKYEKFEEAEHWAETAAKQMPNNSYILHTKGQVYRKWFQAKCKEIDNNQINAQNTADAVKTALKAIECFQECERAAKNDREHLNTYGYFSEVEVSCDLLKLISSLPVFKNATNGRSEYLRYLLTDYIPKDIECSWRLFHDRLKKLHKTMQDALEGISEDLRYFQTDNGSDEDTTESLEEKIRYLQTWLSKKFSEYGKYFQDIVNYILTQISLKCQSPETQKVASLKDLQALRRQFSSDKKKCLPGALFLLTLRFWPEDSDTNHEKEAKYEIVHVKCPLTPQKCFNSEPGGDGAKCRLPASHCEYTGILRESSLMGFPLQNSVLFSSIQKNNFMIILEVYHLRAPHDSI